MHGFTNKEIFRLISNDITSHALQLILQHCHTDTMQVAYHDAPDKAYEVFLGAITTKYLEQRLVIPSLVEAHNPAGKVN